MPSKRRVCLEKEVIERRPVAHGERQARYQVICVVGGCGFPCGALDALRIINVGKALQEGRLEIQLND
jgi:hypothetical protein